MARKYDELTKIYDETSRRLTSPSEWRHFLESACRNYRLRFDEQILLFAQRPDATAVLEIERWNKQFGRWVNKGASGIAVFEDAERNNQRLKYYFDISDTHESRLSRPVPIWNMREEYTEDVVDTLESTFGALENRKNLEESILSAANNAVEDNIPDYVGDLLLTMDDSLLYGLTEDTVRYMYNNLVTHSVAYMLMSRLGMDTSLYYSDDDFKDIINFNTEDSLNALGYATSDISEMALSEIAKTVITLDRDNRTFDNFTRSNYNNDTIQTERRFEHDRDSLHQTGRLQPAQPDPARTASGRAGNVRSDEEQIPERAAQDPVLQPPDEMQADRAPVRHRTDGVADGESDHPRDGSDTRRDGAAEGSGSAQLGEEDEQHPTGSAGNRDEQGDLHHLTPEGQTQSDDEPALSLSTPFGLADRIYDYLTDYIIDYYEEQDGEPIEVPDDGTDPVIVARIEHDLHDTAIMADMLDYFDGHYERFDNDEEINRQYDLIMEALQARINMLDPLDDRYVSGDTRFDVYDEEGEFFKRPFFGVDEVVNEIFATTPYLSASLEDIRAYLEGVSDIDRRIEYIRSIFNDDFTELILSDDTRVGYKTYDNGVLIWKDRYPNREGDRFLHWDHVVGHFDAMRKLGMMRSDIKSLLSQDGQLQYLAEAAGAKAPAFALPQEIIDDVLTRGSHVVESKMRIYEQFQKSLSRDENIRFLKKEYGIGGGSDAVPYTGISEMHDGKGIELSLGFDPDRPRQLLKWNYVEKRISELIKLDRYLNDREKEVYPSWLEKQEQLRAETSEVIRRREEERRRQIEMETAPEERQAEPEQYEYRYHLGDTIYIGATTYELLSIDDDRVMLFDPKFPLINTEMPRAEFEAKIQENPLNNHLRVAAETPSQPEPVKTESVAPVSSTDRYFEQKAQNPESILLFKVGDFYEVMGDDAVTVSEALDLTLTSRRRNDTERVPMVGFPSAVIDSYTNMLLDRGWNVAITKDNGEVLNMVTDRDERPVNSYPIARVDYYKPDGSFDDSIEFTNPARLRSAIINDSPFETMSLYLYRDKDGNVMPHDFIDDLPRPLRSFEIVDSPIIGQSEHTIMLDRAKELINEFCYREYHHSADFDDLSKVNLAYTETEDGLHEIQSYANLEEFSIVTMVDGQIVRTESYDSLQEMVDQGLQDMEFGDLVYVSEEELAPFYEPDEDVAEVVHTAYSNPQNDEKTDHDLSEVDPAEIRARLAESGIVNGEVVDPEKLDADPFIQQVMADAEAAADEQKQPEEVKLRSVVIDLRPDDVIVAEHIGRTVQIDDRDFQIEDVSERGEVLLRDLTFERETGYPVYRREQAGLVRRAIAGQNVQTQTTNELIPAWEQQPRAKAQTFDLHPDIPMSQRHTFDLASNEVETVGKKERFKRNVAAIETLKSCQEENRFATPEEQITLSKYVGWGGIPEAFDEDNTSWQSEFEELRNLLTDEEYTSARASTLTAFYTPPAVINAVYKVMGNMGFQRGNILEPSCGIGNFIGLLPQSMSESRVFGVEIDTISAGIAQQLYQKTSIAAQRYEQAEIPDSFFDAVVGNVPFGDFGVSDKRYDKYHFMIHDYFFAKSLDKLRPGGVMALVTSRGTMDKENPAVRKYIAQRADLLGAIRLPNNTFRGNAGTDAVSDILILQKRDRIIDIEPSWVHLNTDENGITMNSYFVDHPEMILGEMKMVSGRFGMTLDCIPYEDADLSELLNEAVTNIHGEVTDYELDEDVEEDLSIPADPNVRNFSFALVDDKIYFRENSRMIPFDVSATAQNRIKGLIPIRDCVRHLLDMQLNNYPDEDIQKEQERLNTLYDNFTKKYGLISSRANNAAFSMDSSYSLVSSLEMLDEDGNLERKADIFTKRTIKPHEPITSVDTASEALAVSMAEKACVDMDFMSELTGLSEEKIYEDLRGVIFLNPLYGFGNNREPKYLTSDEYLSGNVREKLKVAVQSAQLYPQDYTVNVEALQRVQPEDLKASEISVRLGATWLPVDVVQDFIFEFLDTPYYARWKMKAHYSPITGEWNIENKTYDRTNVKAYSTYGTDRINAYQIIEQTLNLKDVRIYDYIEEPDGKKKPVLNKKETALALAKQEQIKQGFQEWVWADSRRREKLCQIYNEKFNNTRPREYDGSHINFVGMNPEIELREHQRNAVAHILYGGNTLLAHAVGAGKTYEMAAAAMESKRLGLCNKSLFVVPNHLTEQWAAEFLQLYPAANILVATKKDFERKNRRRFCGRIATGDYDAIIIGHSQFEKIPISIERQRMILQAQLDEIVDGIYTLSRSREDKFTVKQLEKSRRSIQAKLNKLNDQSQKDDVVTFEELGVDRLFIDESHYYKNLYLYTKMRNVGGIAQTEAAKSSDLFMKCRYLDELTGGHGTVFATGTPISNSMVELYTIQRYLQYDTLVKNDLQHFDSWASTFGETITAVELTPEGTGYRAKTRFAKFYNLPELMAMFREIADIQTADMLQLPVPKANYHNIAVKPSEMQRDMVQGLAERAEKIRGGSVDARVDNMLNVTNDGRKLALDQRLLNPLLDDFEGSKVNACVDNVFRVWQETSEKRSAQLLFCDLSTPKNEEEFSVYTDIRKKLIERGIPEDEIKFIHEAKTETQKLDLFRKVRKGEVRVLLGSTTKMGAGTNAQNKLIALHDLDCPWRPSDLEQRSGRIIRQGNENPEVDIYRYVTEETFDAYLYQLVEGKQKFCSQIMTSKTPVRTAEDVDQTALSYAEIKMLATGNPYIKEKMELDIAVQKLQLVKAGFLSEKYDLEDKILKYYPQQIAFLSGTIDGLKQDIEVAKQHPKSTDDTFVGMEIKGAFFDDKAKAGQAMLDACKAMKSSDAFHLGSYRDFNMEMYFDTVSRQYSIRLKGRLSHDVKLGTDIHGNITRLDNALDGLEKRLEKAIADLENIKTQFETAKTEVQKPFAQEDELRQKTARLNELNALLDVDKRDNELVDGEQSDVGDDVPDRQQNSRNER